VSLSLVLRRDVLVETYTMGQIMANRRRLCWTLEDPIRERVNEQGYFWRPEFKVPGKTAIPSGRYELVVTDSRRFGRPLIEMLRVPDFTAIRCHGGNTVENTDGCPLLGMERNVNEGRVWNCPPAVDLLTNMVREALKRERVWMEVINP
jgi:hypothetical protein